MESNNTQYLKVGINQNQENTTDYIFNSPIYCSKGQSHSKVEEARHPTDHPERLVLCPAHRDAVHHVQGPV